MREPRILLCHASDDGIQLMQDATRKAVLSCHLLVATNLTEAYNIVEHTSPDCLILQADLAASPEFELLGYLLKKLGVGCVIWNPDEHFIPTLERFQFQHCDMRKSGMRFKEVILDAIKTRPVEAAHTATTRDAMACDPRHIFMIGASTGGVDALTRILCHFDRLTPPTLIVQHTGGHFVGSLIRLLNSVTDAQVEAAAHDMPLKPGHIYLAPDDAHHLSLAPRSGNRIALIDADPMSGHRPSVDVLFQSGVGYAAHITAALLTGMGRDGARGMKALRDAGAHTIAQNQATSVVYGMPRIAAELGAAVEQLPLDQIAVAFLGTARSKVRG
jgi:two-component system chemotaxis response regulator CheB